MSDIPALAPDRILRFHAPDKVFHSLNAITALYGHVRLLFESVG